MAHSFFISLLTALPPNQKNPPRDRLYTLSGDSPRRSAGPSLNNGSSLAAGAIFVHVTCDGIALLAYLLRSLCLSSSKIVASCSRATSLVFVGATIGAHKLSQIRDLKCPVVNASNFREKYALERGTLLHDLRSWASSGSGRSSGDGAMTKPTSNLGSGSGRNDAAGNEMDELAAGETSGKF